MIVIACCSTSQERLQYSGRPYPACLPENETAVIAHAKTDEFRRLKIMYPTASPRYTRRSGCGNGRNARNTGPSTSSRRISGIARRRSTSTTITNSSRRRRRCCRRRKIVNIRSRRSTSTTITTTSSTRGRRSSTSSSRGEPKLSEGVCVCVFSSHSFWTSEMEKHRKHKHTDSSLSAGFLLCTDHNTFAAIFVM